MSDADQQAQQQKDDNDTSKDAGDDGAASGGADKVVIMLKAVGSAPILKKNKFKISAESTFHEVIKFMRTKLLKLKPADPLVRQQFLNPQWLANTN